MIVNIVFVELFFLIVSAHKDGAPEEACITMTPKHPGSISQPVSSALHKLRFATLDSKIGNATTAAITTPSSPDIYVVTISSKNLATKSPEENFKGFFIQARSSLTGEVNPIGSWNFGSSSGLAKSVNCGGIQNSAVTHLNNATKDSLTLLWSPPPNFNGQVIFVATIVKDFKTFWVGIQSDVLTVSKFIESTTPLNNSSSTILPGPVVVSENIEIPLGSAKNITNNSLSYKESKSRGSLLIFSSYCLIFCIFVLMKT